MHRVLQAGFIVFVALLAVLIYIFVIAVANAQDANIETCLIQGRLKTEGYYDGNITCKLGPDTQDAIRAFQDRHGLQQTGFVGPRTYIALFGRPRGSQTLAEPICEDGDPLLACTK
jgi:hypothetical protein